MSERFGGYTTKTYNLLALTLMEKQDFDRALKIFENALLELSLESEEGQEKHLTMGNADLACLVFNNLKCHAIKHGYGEGASFFEKDKLARQLVAYLEKMESPLLEHFQHQRQEAALLFDKAVKSMA